MKRFSALIFAAAALAGCAQTVNPVSGQRELTTMSQDDERKMGAKAHQEITGQKGQVYDDPRLGGYVAQIGGRLASGSELAGQPFTFTVLDSPKVNAYALPGGYVYVTRGLLALANDEAELAGVIGHEIGHVTARHSAQRQTKQTVAGLGVALATIGAAVLGGGELAQSVGQIGQMAGGGYVASFSRDQELQADQLGVRYLSQAGYDPFGQADFLKKMQEIQSLGGKDANSVSFLSSHPATAQRVSAAAGAAKGAQGAVGAPRNREAYLRAIDGMAYGENPDKGVIRGRDFYFPPMNVAFTAPDGFKIRNEDDAVYVDGPNGVAAKFEAGKGGGGDMRAALQAWASKAKVQLQQLEPITLNGMPAATATTIAPVNGTRMFARLIMIDGGAHVFRFLMVAPTQLSAQADGPFQRLAASVRRMSYADSASIRPRRIALRRVGYGDTAESLAAQCAFDEDGVAKFRIMNGLLGGAQPKPGDMVKMVVAQ